jgi:CRP-like cAMP-binding protein
VRQLELTERILRLRGVPVLRGMPANELAQLAASIRHRTFQRGEILLREDEPPRSFFLLGSGTVTMWRQGLRIGTVRGPGGVGFLSFLARNAGGTAAVAQSYVEAYEVPGDAMEEIFEDHFAVLLGTIRWVAERLIKENQASPPPPYVPPERWISDLVGPGELGIVERIFLLRRSRAFAQANVNSLARIAGRMEEVCAPAGTTFWVPGDVADFAYWGVKGMLRLVWNEGTFVQRVGPGYTIGGAESVVGIPRWNELVADEDVVLLKGNREAMIDLFEDDGDLAMRFMSLLGSQLMSIWDQKAVAGVAAVGTLADSERSLGAAVESS